MKGRVMTTATSAPGDEPTGEPAEAHAPLALRGAGPGARIVAIASNGKQGPGLRFGERRGRHGRPRRDHLAHAEQTDRQGR